MGVLSRASSIAFCLLAYPCLFVIALILIVVGGIARFLPRPMRSARPAGQPEAATDEIVSSIVIPNWNGCHLLEECLPSVVASVAATAGCHEIIVVDNASTDGSVPYLKEHFPTVRVIALDENRGFGGGCNAGAQAACGRYLVVLNNDMKVGLGFLG